VSVKSQPSPADQEAPRLLVQPSLLQGLAQAVASPPASILSVISDPMVRDRLMELAMDAGYGVYCATGALEALAVLGRERPGAVLIEQEMETGAGIRFLDIFRQLRRHEDVLCLVVTRSPQDELRRSEPRLDLENVVMLQKPGLSGLEEALAGHFRLSP
jgi:CheY-like chemotaxis protein